MITAFLFKQ